jgi:hypothetical protein
MKYKGKEFTQIKGCCDYFICKDSTEVLSLKSGFPRILKQANNSSDPDCNYYVVTMRCIEDEERKNRFIHRLMCETFLPNPDGKAHVNHKDGNKLNNSLANLEWATPAENNAHARETGLSKPHEYTSKEVHQFTLKGVYVASYPSDADASRATGIPAQNINKVALGKREHAGYYLWSRDKASIKLPLRRVPSHFLLEDRDTGYTEECKYRGGDIADKLKLNRDYIKAMFNRGNTDFIAYRQYNITIKYYN